MRSIAREDLFKYLYSKLFNQTDEGLFDVLTKDLSDVDKKFANDLLEDINLNIDKYNGIVDSLVKRYKSERVYAIDRLAIVMGIAELNKFPLTPKPVVIDEAVKISAKFSTEKSTDFVNGILAEYIKVM